MLLMLLHLYDFCKASTLFMWQEVHLCNVSDSSVSFKYQLVCRYDITKALVLLNWNYLFFFFFFGMVDWRKVFHLISSRDHCQRFSPSQFRLSWMKLWVIDNHYTTAPVDKFLWRYQKLCVCHIFKGVEI